jgi:hypothetical protein
VLIVGEKLDSEKAEYKDKIREFKHWQLKAARRLSIRKMLLIFHQVTTTLPHTSGMVIIGNTSEKVYTKLPYKQNLWQK